MKNNSLQLNPNVDYIKDIKNSKQDKLTAGEGITIDENNVISSTGGKQYLHVIKMNVNKSGSILWMNCSLYLNTNEVLTVNKFAQIISGTDYFPINGYVQDVSPSRTLYRLSARDVETSSPNFWIFYHTSEGQYSVYQSVSLSTITFTDYVIELP